MLALARDAIASGATEGTCLYAGDAKLGRSPSPSSRPEAALEAEAGFWQCSGCTLANHDMSATACEVCETPRPAR